MGGKDSEEGKEPRVGSKVFEQLHRDLVFEERVWRLDGAFAGVA